jgi:phosphoribosyl 1,2-cyclic phosphodiesterase
MDIECWGSRGSIAVSDKDTLKYGGDTTCLVLTATSGETVIIDAGTGIRRLGTSFIDRNITRYHLLFTHAHWDHVMGFPFFKPVQHSRAALTIQDRLFGGLTTEQVLERVMQNPFFPITLKDLKASIRFDKGLNGCFSIGSLNIETIETSHPGGGLGYKFTENGRSFVFLTDNELGFDHPGSPGFDAYVDFCENADILFHDGEYTPREYKRKKTWGHSSISDVVALAVKARVKQLGIFHLGQDRTDDEIDRMVQTCRADLKQKKANIDCFAVSCSHTLSL